MIKAWFSHHPARRITLAIIILALVAFIVFLIFMAFHESHRHNELNASIDKLQVSLERHGITSKKTSGCGRPYSEFGRGNKSCAISIRSKEKALEKSTAVVLLRKYESSIEGSGSFSVSRKLPSSLPNEDGFNFGFATYYEKQTGDICGVDYNYAPDKGLISIGFSCDDTSWFVKTFEG